MLDLAFLRKKTARYVVGLMSGSSCDGIDAALVRLKGTGSDMAMKLLEYRTFPFETGFRTRLLGEHLGAKEVCLLSFALGERLAEAATEMMELGKQDNIIVDFVASHGHTVAHFPPRTNTRVGTLQIGEPAIIAEQTGVPVISDFRQRDMAAGGQGAPLVPYADWLLFRKEDRTVSCLNIGGIANFTVVPPLFEDVLAFDTGPGNMAIDGTVRLLTKGTLEMDEDGKAATKGDVVEEFKEYLLSHKYFSKVPPKSTGRDEFGAEIYLRDALTSRRDHGYEDLVATVTEAVASSIAEAFRRFIGPHYNIHHIIVGGGGAKNQALMEMIRRGLPEVKVFTSDQYGIPHCAREAIAFAILGNETVCGTAANVPQATGAEHPVVLGRITPA